MKPLLDQAFWSDPDIEKSKSGVKLSALWLITNAQTSLLGICCASPRRFEFETGLPAVALQGAIEALPRAFVRFGDCVFVRNYIRHQFGSGEKLIRNNFFVALKSLFLNVKDEELRKCILLEYPEFSKPSEGLTKPKDGEDRKGKDKRESAEREVFRQPTREEAVNYGREIGMVQADVLSWYDHFDSNGWKVGGKAKMKDWQAALRNGQRNASKNGNGKTETAEPVEPADWTEFAKTAGYSGQFKHAPEYLKLDFAKARKRQ